MEKFQAPESEGEYPEPTMFGALPATGFFIRHVKNLEMSNVEIAVEKPDQRPAFTLVDVDDADFFRVRVPRQPKSNAFRLTQVRSFRVFGSRFVQDQESSYVDNNTI